MPAASSSTVSAVFRTDHPCGCYYETSYDITGEVCLIRARTCTKCWEGFFSWLERECLDNDAQLTLDLASTHGRAGESSN